MFDAPIESISRRHLLAGGIAAAALALPTAARASDAPLPDTLTSDAEARLVERARRELERSGNAVWIRDKVGLVDFTLPSRDPRFFLVDMEQGRIKSYFVTHGRGSDPEHDGWLKSFSNEPSSNASSRGAYTTGRYYEGKHGLSMRLTGLDADNSNAEDRAIVVHGAWYANPDLIPEMGKLGRSEGCFAFPEAKLIEVIANMGPGRLLFADKL